jgi:seryl-tRNA(Sec) selenium transferase
MWTQPQLRQPACVVNNHTAISQLLQNLLASLQDVVHISPGISKGGNGGLSCTVHQGGGGGVTVGPRGLTSLQDAYER